VSLCEIVALEEQRLARRLRQRVSNAVAEIQACRMCSSAEAAKGAARDLGLIGIEGHDLDPGAMKKQIQLASCCRAAAGLDDISGLDDRRCGNQPPGCSGNLLDEACSLGLQAEDRDQRRTVDHHQLGSPFSSYPRISSSDRSS